MKYYKPEIHLISATEGHATCADGSNATPIEECAEGGGRLPSGGVVRDLSHSGVAELVLPLLADAEPVLAMA